MQLKTFRIIIFLVITLTGFVIKTNAQGWTFTFTLTNSGPCGAYVPSLPNFTVPNMPTQSFCESLRQEILNIRASSPVYDVNGKYIGECSVYYICTACTGSDIVFVVDNSSPGSVSIDGLMQGSAFFSPHESKSVENWINDFNQKMESMGMVSGKTYPTPVQDIPITGDADFDKFYADQTIRFEKPEQGGVVDLTGKSGVVDLLGKTGDGDLSVQKDVSSGTIPVMGSSPLTADEIERINAYNLKTIPDNRLDESNFKMEESPFWTTPEMIQLGTDALKFSAGFVSGGYVAVVGVDVISGVLNKKSGQEILIDIAGDVLTKKIGDVVGTAVGKGSLSIGKLEVKTGIPSGAGAKQDYEIISQSGQSLLDAWSAPKIGNK